MKIRNGFISNSSSSSFILGLGKITNFEIFSSWFSNWKKPVGYGQKVIVEGTSAIIEKDWDIEKDWENNQISLKCEYGEKQIVLPIDFTKEELFVIVDLHNDEGDGDYRLTDCVYDGKEFIEEFFEPRQRELIHLSEKQGVSGYVSVFGCGRND